MDTSTPTSPEPEPKRSRFADPSTFAPHIFKTAAQVKAEALTEAKRNPKASQVDNDDTG